MAGVTPGVVDGPALPAPVRGLGSRPEHACLAWRTFAVANRPSRRDGPLKNFLDRSGTVPQKPLGIIDAHFA
jgi:hypothetical protein